MASLEGKVIALTGAASGIGLATAQLLASRGAVLSIGDVNEAGLDATLASFTNNSGKHIATVIDVRSSKSVNAWLDDTVARLGKLDAIASIAGVCVYNSPLAEETDEHWDFVMDVNAKGVFNCTRAALKHLPFGGSIVRYALGKVVIILTSPRSTWHR